MRVVHVLIAVGGCRWTSPDSDSGPLPQNTDLPDLVPAYREMESGEAWNELGASLGAAAGAWASPDRVYADGPAPSGGAFVVHADGRMSVWQCSYCYAGRVALPGDVFGDGSIAWLLGDLDHGWLRVTSAVPGVDYLFDDESPPGIDIEHPHPWQAQVAPCGDVSGDGIDDLCLATGIWRGPVTPTPTASWEVDAEVTVAAGDPDGDGQRSVYVGVPGGVARVEGSAVGSVNLGSQPTWIAPGRASALGAGDLDGTGSDVLVVAIGPEVWRVEADLETARLLDTHPAGRVTALAVGDLDGDGRAEIVAGAPPEVRVIGGDGSVRAWWRGERHPDDAFGQALALADIDLDGSNELIVGAPGIGGGTLYFVRGLPAGP